MGYKSVAHYLIQTRRSDTNVEKNEDDASNTDVEKNDDASNPVSAKRSLPFLDAGDNKSQEVIEYKIGSMQPPAETETNVDEVATKRSLCFADEQDQLKKVDGSDSVKTLASSTKPSPDSIAGRLRSRIKKQ